MDRFLLLWHKIHSMTTSFKLHEFFSHSHTTTIKIMYKRCIIFKNHISTLSYIHLYSNTILKSVPDLKNEMLSKQLDVAAGPLHMC